MATGRRGRPDLIAAARELRRTQTPAERALWRLLRDDRLGVPVRRQHVMDRFVVDFCVPRAKLVIEVDGAVHDSSEAREQDAWRSERLSELGYTVLRLRNDDVLVRPEAVITLITEHLSKKGVHSQQPSSA